jgi:hypothetical protein
VDHSARSPSGGVMLLTIVHPDSAGSAKVAGEP